MQFHNLHALYADFRLSVVALSAMFQYFLPAMFQYFLPKGNFHNRLICNCIKPR